MHSADREFLPRSSKSLQRVSPIAALARPMLQEEMCVVSASSPVVPSGIAYEFPVGETVPTYERQVDEFVEPRVLRTFSNPKPSTSPSASPSPITTRSQARDNITLHLDRLLIAQLLDLRRPFIINKFVPADPDVIHRPITMNTLAEIILQRRPSVGSPSQRPLRRKRTYFWQRRAASPSGEQNDEDDDNEVESVNLERDVLLLLQRCNVQALSELGETLASLLQYDLPGIPVLERSTLDAVLHIADRQPVVWEEQIRTALMQDRYLNNSLVSEDNNAERLTQAVQFFFEHCAEEDESSSSESDEDGETAHEKLSQLQRGRKVSSITVRQLVMGLSSTTTPCISRVRFSRQFTADMVHTMRTLGTSLLYLALFIAVIVWIARLQLLSRFGTFLAASAPSHPWTTFCRGGVVDGRCHFETRTVEDAVSSVEATLFVQFEIIKELWKFASLASDSPLEARAADVMYNGAWLVGGLMIRQSPSIDAEVRSGDTEPAVSCGRNNISVTLDEPFLARYFDCSSWKTTVIPFNMSLEQALSAAKHFSVDDVPNWVVAATILQFATYNPSNGNIAWVSTILGTPRYGGIATRINIQVLDTSLHSLISFCMWSSLTLVILDSVVFVVLISYRNGLARATMNLLLRYALFGFIVAAYAILRDAKPSDALLEDLLQTEYIAPTLDEVVSASQQAELLLGLWIFALIAIVAQLTGYFHGLQQVVKLFGIIIPELLGLFFVFGFFYVGFVLVAMSIFGSTVDTYANFYTANAALIRYFFADFDLESFLGNYPQVGFAFYYVFRCFLLFVVTNFCIVTVIAPIKTVWIEGDLPIIVASVYADSHTGLLNIIFAKGKRVLVTVAVFIVNATPLLFLPYWLRVNSLLDGLYTTTGTDQSSWRTVAMRKRVASAHKLLDLRDQVFSRNFEESRDAPSAHAKMQKPYDSYYFQSDMLTVASSTRVSNYSASYSLSLLVISAETSLAWLRNERLLHLLLVFDEHSTQMENAFKPAENESERVAPLLTAEKIRQQATHAATATRVGDDDGDATTPQFKFIHYLGRKLQDTDFPSDRFYVLFSVFERLAIVGLYVALVITIVLADRDSVYFIRNVNSGLRDLPFIQNCFDRNCTEASTRPMTYMDCLNLQDLRTFTERRLAPSLFRSNSSSEGEDGEGIPNLSEMGDLAVEWDPHIYRSGPIIMRQIRGAPVLCVSPISSSSLLPQQKAVAQKISGGSCASATSYTTAPMVRPSQSLLPAEAYLWANVCEQEDKSSVHGLYNEHWPCSGYSVAITSQSQLLYAANEWLDEATRLVVIQVQLGFGGKSQHSNNSRDEIAYTMVAEFSHGGSAGRFFVRSRPIGDKEIANINTVAAILMAVELALALISIYVPWVYVFCRARHRLRAKTFLSWRIMICICYFVLYIARSASASNNNTATTAYLDLSCVVLTTSWLTISILFRLLFPVALFWFRRVTMVNDFIALALIQVVQLVPLFFMLITAFATAGYVMWGSRVESFATFDESFRTVSQAILGDFDFPDLYVRNTSYAIIYALLMLIVMVILALNLLLAVIAGCAEEARDASLMMRPIETRATLMRVRVHYGPMFAAMLGKLLQKATSRASLHQEASFDSIMERNGVMYTIIRWWFSHRRQTHESGENGVEKGVNLRRRTRRENQIVSLDAFRAPLPLECLQTHLSPLLFNEVVTKFSLASQPVTMVPSSIACVLQTYQYFEKNYQGLVFQDKKTERSQIRLVTYTGGSVTTRFDSRQTASTLEDTQRRRCEDNAEEDDVEL